MAFGPHRKYVNTNSDTAPSSEPAFRMKGLGVGWFVWVNAVHYVADKFYWGSEALIAPIFEEHYPIGRDAV
jgi:hypothetical protein